MNTSASRLDSNASDQRERLLSMVAGGLGILMFVWGFLKWFGGGDGDSEQTFSGFAFSTPSSAVIGFSLAAGLVAVLGAMDRRAGRGVPSAVPTALAATSFLLAVGIFIGKDSIDPELGVDAEIGLILGLATALIQTIVLGLGLGSRYDNEGANASRQRV
jgi:hypothetical protein